MNTPSFDILTSGYTIYEAHVYIPRVRIEENYSSVDKVFRECLQNMVKVIRVKFAKRHNDNKYKSAYVSLLCPTDYGGPFTNYDGLHESLWHNYSFKLYLNATDNIYWTIKHDKNPHFVSKFNFPLFPINKKSSNTIIDRLKKRIKVLEESNEISKFDYETIIKNQNNRIEELEEIIEVLEHKIYLLDRYVP